MKKLYKEITGIDREQKKEILAHDPIAIIPTIALESVQGELRLLVRSDIFNAKEGFEYMAYRHCEVGITDSFLERIYESSQEDRPVICFYSFTNQRQRDLVNCDKGPGKCVPFDIIFMLRKIAKAQKMPPFNPRVLCCRAGNACMAKASVFEKGSRNRKCYPFRIVESKPPIYGYRIHSH